MASATISLGLRMLSLAYTPGMDIPIRVDVLHAPVSTLPTAARPMTINPSANVAENTFLILNFPLRFITGSQILLR